jgi:hypothetical protein
MEPRRRASREFSFRLWLAAAGLLLFSWPLLTGPGELDSLLSFRFLFLVWGLVILVLWLLGRDDPENPGGTGGPGG